MATIDEFVNAWIFSSETDSDSFPHEHTLLIGIADAEKTKCDVVWQNRPGTVWCITGIPLVDGALKSDSIEVRSVQQSSNCSVMLSIQSNGLLKGEIDGLLHRLHNGNGPVGTFTAEAGSGEEVVGATRLEESLAV